MTQVAGAATHAGRSHVAGTRTQVVGLTLLALAPLTMFAIGAAVGVAVEESVPFVVIGVVLAAAALAAGRYGTWSKVLGLVLTVAAVLAGFWLAFGLAAVARPGDFVPGVLFVLGVVLSLTGGIQAIAGRRRTPVTTATRGEGRARLVAVVAVGLAVVASTSANLVGRETVDPAVAAAATPVIMDALEFTSGEVSVASGSDTALLVRNQDAFVHDLEIPGEGVAVLVNPGSEALLDISGLAPGTYTFYCTLHSDTSDPDPASAGMAGTLVVQ